jgi:hypothetical protein
MTPTTLVNQIGQEQGEKTVKIGGKKRNSSPVPAQRMGSVWALFACGNCLSGISLPGKA